MDSRDTPRQHADKALDLVPSDPALAERLATAAVTADDQAAVSIAERALGLLARRRHELQVAELHERRAVAAADTIKHDQLAAAARVALSGTLAMAGRFQDALRELDIAGRAKGTDRGTLELQRGTVLAHLGRDREAFAAWRRAEAHLHKAGADRFLAMLYNNRALQHSGRGALQAAAKDLTLAEQLFVQLRDDVGAAEARQNLGFVLARAGQLPQALEWFDRADELMGEHVDAIGLRDRCEALLRARLIEEARSTAERAVDELAKRGLSSYEAEARLMLAEAALLDGDLSVAGEQARMAASEFDRERRTPFAARARHIELRVSQLAAKPTAALLTKARKTAAALHAAGWIVDALDARLLAAHLAFDLGRVDVAREELRPAERVGGTTPVSLRVRAWHAKALLRLADGNRRGARAALQSGLRDLDRYRAALGATELRAHAAGHGDELARLGLQLALEDRSAAAVFAWAERWRAGALQLRPVRPPNDRELAQLLADLRQVAADLERSTREGEDTEPLLRRQSALEQSVRARARHARGVAEERLQAPRPAELHEALGDRALVEYVALDGIMHVVVGANGRLAMRTLGPAAEVARELEHFRFAAHRLARDAAPSRLADAALASMIHAAARLDALLLRPVARLIGDRSLVVVPTGALHALPWTGLPSVIDRAVTVAPSAAVWQRATTSSRRRRKGVVLAAGPGLRHAAPEVKAIARLYPEASRLAGRAATAGSVSAAMEQARLAHLACHGRFRADNPLFSSLRLADGPLTVYDLERLRRTPDTIVLSACDSGLSAVHPGDELMGLSSALFALGTKTLIASVVPVPDEATRALMLAFHRALQSGSTPAAALAAARGAVGTGPAERVAAAGFVCFGAG